MKRISSAAATRLRTALTSGGIGGLPARYQLIDQLGEGGMGVVWRALDTELAREVAVKVLAPYLADGELASRLGREARLLAALEHPGIVPVFDLGTTDGGVVWYAMRLVRGAPLDIAAHDGRDRTALLRIVEQLCDTIAFAHSRGVVHRDLKPGNVMLGEFGDVLVLDWGVARDAAPDFADGTVVGTPGFMSPEQAAGQPGDTRSDIYGIGGLLRALVAVHDAPVPPALRSIIARACAPCADDRYVTALDLRDDLRRFTSGGRVLAHRETAFETARRIASTHRTAILLILGYLVMRLTILLWRGI